MRKIAITSPTKINREDLNTLTSVAAVLFSRGSLLTVLTAVLAFHYPFLADVLSPKKERLHLLCRSTLLFELAHSFINFNL